MMTAHTDYARDEAWFAARTRSRQERVAATLLDAVGVTHFLPLHTEVHQWSDRMQAVTTPLFKGYLFVRLNPIQDTRLRVLKTPGIAGIVGNQTGPLPIPDHEIDSIRTVVAQRAPCTTHPYLCVGERVRVMRGPLSGVEGTLVRSQDDFKLLISVQMIQQSIAITIHASDVRPAGVSACKEAGQMRSVTTIA
jgi:transcription antitermination factor NusG